MLPATVAAVIRRCGRIRRPPGFTAAVVVSSGEMLPAAVAAVVRRCGRVHRPPGRSPVLETTIRIVVVIVRYRGIAAAVLVTEASSRHLLIASCFGPCSCSGLHRGKVSVALNRLSHLRGLIFKPLRCGSLTSKEALVFIAPDG
jgi:hypothetical protein